jgi:hypothetical protein
MGMATMFLEFFRFSAAGLSPENEMARLGRNGEQDWTG